MMIKGEKSKPEMSGTIFLPSFNKGSVNKRKKSAIGPCQFGLIKLMTTRMSMAKNKISQG